MTPDPVTTALSALREKALAAVPPTGEWNIASVERLCALQSALPPALIAALCDVALGVEDQERRYGLLTTQIRLARNHLAAVIKETGNG